MKTDSMYNTVGSARTFDAIDLYIEKVTYKSNSIAWSIVSISNTNIQFPLLKCGIL